MISVRREQKNFKCDHANRSTVKSARGFGRIEVVLFRHHAISGVSKDKKLCVLFLITLTLHRLTRSVRAQDSVRMIEFCFQNQPRYMVRKNELVRRTFQMPKLNQPNSLK